MSVKFKNLRAVCSRQSRSLIRSFSDICQKKKQQKFVSFKFKKALEQLAQEISSNHRYEVHPIGGETEESHHGYTCSHCTKQFNINIFIIAVLNKSEKVLGCKSK